MDNRIRTKSVSLTALMISSLLVGLLSAAPTAMAANETSSGVITGTETWSGSHPLTGDVIIASGAKLIVNPGTTVTIPNGTYIDVRGALCAGDVSCGANGMASNSSRVTFKWNDPADDQANGSCYGGLPFDHWNRDPSCYEGILLRNTVDISKTKLNHVSIEDAYGIPRWVQDVQQVRYGAIVLDGASPTLTGLKFTDINTTSLLIMDLASPLINGGEFTVGSDDTSLIGAGIQAYGAGTLLDPFEVRNAVFESTDKGCGQQDDGRYAMWAEKSFVDIQGMVVETGDYGLRLDDSAGSVTSGTFDVKCNAIDLNGRMKVGDTPYKLDINYNQATTEENSPFTAYDDAWAEYDGNIIDGASGGSGFQVFNSEVVFKNGVIGPIGGWNGIWSIGRSDVTVINTVIQDTAKEPLIAGEYHAGESGWNVPGPDKNRMYVRDSTITADAGDCTSTKIWGGDFACPALSAFRSSVTMINNDVAMAGTDNDALRIIGSIVDIRDNTFTAQGVGARVINHDTGYAGADQFGSLGFFSGNTWSNITQAYNVTKSSITVQSETIPATAPGTYPVSLSWPDAEANDWNEYLGKVILTSAKDTPPQEFPLALELTNNSTTFTFANLTNLDTDSIFIDTSPIKWAVQVRRAELVKFRAVVDGVRVADTQIIIEDAHGNDLYDLRTDALGWSEVIALPSDFHLDFRGLAGGDNPDGFASDPLENSCNDGVDNDGDLI